MAFVRQIIIFSVPLITQLAIASRALVLSSQALTAKRHEIRIRGNTNEMLASLLLRSTPTNFPFDSTAHKHSSEVVFH